MKIVMLTMGMVMGLSSLLMGQVGDVFYDRFDSYCFNPMENGLCPGSPSDPGYPPIARVGALRNVWVWSSWNYNTNRRDGVNMTIEDNQSLLFTAPYGGRHANGGDEGSRLGQNTVDLTPYIGNVHAGSNVISGTDLTPLVLRFFFSGGIGEANATRYGNGYLELALDDAQAPTDYVMVGVPEDPEAEEPCYSCFRMCSGPHFSVHVPWPTICQSYTARTASPRCPPMQTNVRSALAIGALAMLDNDPCHCDITDDQVPHNDHVSYYDGLAWRSLRQNQFPGYGDFVLGDKHNEVVLTIKSTTVDIWHRTRTSISPDVWTISEAWGVPRLYEGAFNKLRAGTGVGCSLANGSYTCLSPRRPIRMGEFRCDGLGWQTNKSKFISFDRVRVRDGVGGIVTQTGACCLPNGTCAIGSAAECAGLGGLYQGDGLTCQEATCCPIPFADADADGDVDQLDFGLFQACFTGQFVELEGGCECFDRTGDGHIDADDFLKFNACFSGPSIPANAACENAP